MSPAAAAGDIFQLVVTVIAVTYQIACVPFQKGFRIFSVPCRGVLIQLDFVCTIYPHTGLGFGFPVLFMQYLNYRFISMNDPFLQKLRMQSLYDEDKEEYEEEAVNEDTVDEETSDDDEE